MKKILKTTNGLVTTVLGAVCLSLFASCDDHEPADQNVHIGYVLCDDHTCMDTATYFNQSARQAVGVVFAEKTEDHNALVVMFEEVEEVFCDSVGMNNGTSGSLTDYDGYANTTAMYNSYDRSSGKGSPLAMSLFAFHTHGQSDYAPSVSEMRLLVAAASSVNPIIERFGGTPIAVDGSDCWYWTSTEVSENGGLQAWLCSAANGGILQTPKTERHKARAIVEINYPEE